MVYFRIWCFKTKSLSWLIFQIIIIVLIDKILLSNHVKELIDKNVVWFYSLVACISIL